MYLSLQIPEEPEKRSGRNDIFFYCCPVKINRKFCISLFIGVAAVLLI